MQSLAVIRALAVAGCVFALAASDAMAVTGQAAGGTAAAAQYPQPVPPPGTLPGSPTTAPSQSQSTESTAPPSLQSPATPAPAPTTQAPSTEAPSTEAPTTAETPGGSVLPTTESPSEKAPTAAAQEQAAEKGKGLPFTGFAALTVLALGAAALLAGVALRRLSAQR
jgi:hypothetical protein